MLLLKSLKIAFLDLHFAVIFQLPNFPVILKCMLLAMSITALKSEQHKFW